MIKRLTLFLLFFAVLNLHSQNSIIADSLQKSIRAASSDSSKSRLLSELALQYKLKDTTLAKEYLDRSFKLASSSSYSLGLGKYYEAFGEIRLYYGLYHNAISLFDHAISHYLLAQDEVGQAGAIVDQGNAYLFLAEYEKAFKNYRFALDIYEKNQLPYGICRCLNNMGIIYKNHGEYSKALDTYRKTKDIYEASDDKLSLIDTYINIGNVYVILSDYDLALNYYSNGLEISQELGVKKSIAMILLNMGVIYNKMSDYDKALEFYSRSLKILKKLDDKINISKCLTNIGTNYTEMEKYDLAREYIYKGLSIKKELGDRRSISNGYNFLAEIQFHLGDYNNAIELDKEAIKYKKEFNDIEGLARCYVGVSRAYLKLGELKMALSFADSALTYGESIDVIEHIVSSYYLKKEIFAALGNYPEAYKMSVAYKSFSDSLMNERKARAVNEIEIKYQTKFLEEENELLRLQSSLDAEKMRRQDMMFYAFLIISILLAAILLLVIYFQSRQKRLNKSLYKKNQIITKQNLKLDRLIKTKNTILSIIAHDLRGTIGNQLTTISLINEGDLIDNEERKRLLSKLENTASVSLELLENLLSWSKMQEGLIKYTPTQEDIRDVIRDVIKNLGQMVTDKQLLIKNELDKSIPCFIDKYMINELFRILLSNAGKYSMHGGEINITYSFKDKLHHFEIKDHGIGISKQDIHNIYKGGPVSIRFGTDNEKGSGIGLTLVKEFLEYHQGTLEITSEQQSGTSFIVKLPCTDFL